MMEEKLPKGWTKVKAGDIFDINMGQSPPSSSYNEIQKGYPFFQGKAEFGKLYSTVKKYTTEPKKVVDKNTVLLSVRAPVGPTNLAPIKSCIGRGLAGISSKNIPYKFILYYFRNIENELSKQGTGTTFTAINKSLIQNLIVNLPPQAEQKRIVAKLDALFGHLDRLKTKLDRIPELLKNFRQQVLTQAVTGELTKEWREGKGLGEWEQKKLTEICISITDGDHQAPPKSEKGIPFLVISDISNGKLDLKKVLRFVPIDYFESLKESRKPRKNDILYTVTGSIGIPVLLKENFVFTFQRHIGIIRPDIDRVNQKYLYYTLMSDVCYKQGKSVATGTAQLTIPLRGLRNYDIPLSSLQEQNEIVKRIDCLFELADKIEGQYQSLKEKIDQLPQAILNKAFKGELVEQEVKGYELEGGEGLMAAEYQEGYKGNKITDKLR